MAGATAIADVTASLMRLLRSHMRTPVEVTSGPPDVNLGGIGPRINLYLIQLIESAALRNMDIPTRTGPSSPGRPPLSLELRYLMTSHPEREDQLGGQATAERTLGDAMSVMHFYGPRIHQETVRSAAAGLPPGSRILEESLVEEFEQVKISLLQAELEDYTKVWSALSTVNMRLSVVYRVGVIQIEDEASRPAPAPVETRALAFATGRRPEILAAHLAAPPGQPRGETRLRIGDTLEIAARGVRAGPLYVRLGELDPIRVVPDLSEIVRIVLPDTQYPPDLDNPLARPIPPEDRLRAGVLVVQLEAEVPTDVVSGGLGAGVSSRAPRRYGSNLAFVQLVPTVTGVSLPSGSFADVLRVDGVRLWHPGAKTQVILGDAAVDVRRPEDNEFAVPEEDAVEVQLAAFQDALPEPPPAGDLYPVAVQSDGARSRDLGVAFTLVP